MTVSIPALNFGSTVQADYKLEQLLSKNDLGQFVIDFDVLRGSAQESNFSTVDMTANLFSLNIKTTKGVFSFFSNTRATANISYGEPLMEFLANGNVVGEIVDLSDTKVLMNGFNEFGLGYANEFLDKKLTVGARVKLIQGIFHGSLDESFQGTLHTGEEDFLWTMNVNNGQINTAGLDYFFNPDAYESNDFTSYVIGNRNKSVAFDLGAKYQVLPFLKDEASINDIGKIKWSE